MDLHSKSIKCNKRSPAFSSFKEKECRAFYCIYFCFKLPHNTSKKLLRKEQIQLVIVHARRILVPHAALIPHAGAVRHVPAQHIHALRRTVAAMQTNAQTHRIRGLRRQLFHRLIYITLARLQFLSHHKASHRHAGAFIKPHRRFIKRPHHQLQRFRIAALRFRLARIQQRRADAHALCLRQHGQLLHNRPHTRQSNRIPGISPHHRAGKP